VRIPAPKRGPKSNRSPGYGNDRVRAYLFVPRNVSPPYQVVVGFPPGEAFAIRSSRELSLRWAAFIVQSGRAFLYPVYKGTYERSLDTRCGAKRRA
jgi:eukaryotic-like serine/threonine-protein kinase